jgi:hypothetical protein
MSESRPERYAGFPGNERGPFENLQINDELIRKVCVLFNWVKNG